MARITVDNCFKYIDNRFDLVNIAAKRASQLNGGNYTTLKDNGDKPTVTALREIESGLINASILNDDDTNAFLLNNDIKDVEAELDNIIVDKDD